MSQSTDTNRQIVLAERPVGEPNSDTLRLASSDIPVAGTGEMLLRTEYLSLDPYMRGRMNDAKSYADPVAIGAPMVGGTVAQVVSSNLDGFSAGDWVLSFSGWQDYAVSDGVGVTNMGQNPAHPSWALGIMGMPGLTAYAGLLFIGEPKEGETVVTAAATGPVGATVGQIAKIKGCRAVGIAGGAEKCAHAVNELGFDACLDYREAGLSKKISQACPTGVDVYFDNVGGKILESALNFMNERGRAVCCGAISQYDTDTPTGPRNLPGVVVVKRLKMEGFIVMDFAHNDAKALRALQHWVSTGQIKVTEDIVEGLESAPAALIGLLAGDNKGKRLVRVAADPS